MAPFMSPFFNIGPASMSVWISSPVRSRKPVLMKTTRSRACRWRPQVEGGSTLLVHNPHLERVGRRPSAASTRPNNSTAQTSSAP